MFKRILQNQIYNFSETGKANKHILKQINVNSNLVIKHVWQYQFPIAAPPVRLIVWGEIKREYIDLLGASGESSQYVNKHDAVVRKFLLYANIYENDTVMPHMSNLILKASIRALDYIDLEKVGPLQLLEAHGLGLFCQTVKTSPTLPVINESTIQNQDSDITNQEFDPDLATYDYSLAKKEVPQGQIELAISYAKGNGVTKDQAEALKWFKLAEKHECAETVARAKLHIARYYAYEESMVTDRNEAKFWISKAAAIEFHPGTLSTINEIADHYSKIPTDSARIESAYWLEEAANLGSKEAQRKIALSYEFRVGVQKDYAVAYCWAHIGGAYDCCERIRERFSEAQLQNEIVLAAKQGFSAAQYYIANLFREEIRGNLNVWDRRLDWYNYEGEKLDFDYPNMEKLELEWHQLAAENNFIPSVRKLIERSQEDFDEREEEKWLIMLAEMGDVQAQYRLVQLYSEGEKVEKNSELASKWSDRSVSILKIHASRSDVNAQRMLADIFLQQNDSKETVVEAIKLYQLAAEQGDQQAQVKLAECYHFKLDIQDYIEAEKWYLLAANQGSNFAKERLAEIYETEDSELLNYEKSAEIYKQLKGSFTADIRLAGMLIDGRGVEKNIAEAESLLREHAWHNQSKEQMLRLYENSVGEIQEDEAIAWCLDLACQGKLKAQEFLAKLLTKGVNLPVGDSTITALTTLSEKGDANAQIQLGSIYEIGSGVVQDFVLAHKWYNVALNLNARERVAQKMSIEDVSEAQKLARKFHKNN